MQKIETLRELQMAIFKVLCDVADLCEEQGFRYTLAGGTMLGAIRHKGFIPWDDDIDIMLPRPDYEALIEYCRTHETKFKLLCNKIDSRYGYLFAKAWDPKTKIVEQKGNRHNIDYGLYVDIFPLDSAGDSVDDIIKRLNEYGIEPVVVDPWASERDAMLEYGVKLSKLDEVKDADCVISAVAHNEFKALGLAGIKKFYKNVNDAEKVLIDVKGLYTVEDLKASGMQWWRL